MYIAGVLTYHLLTQGQLLRRGETMVSLRKLNPILNKAVEKTIARACEGRAERRHKTLEVFGSKLQAV